MTGALSWLLFTKLKNQLKQFVRSPAKLIYAIIILALLVFMLVSGQYTNAEGVALRDVGEVGAMVTALYAVMFVIMAKNGFNTGGTMFSMADVNLVFTSPLSAVRALFYALFQQMGTSVLLGFFLLFQYGWLHNVYGISFGPLLVILVGYGLSVFFGQITAMVIYAFTSADPAKKRRVQVGFYAVVLLFIAGAAVTAEKGGLLPFLVSAVGGPVFRFFPVGGWLGGAFAGILGGDWLMVALGLGLCAVFLAALVCAVVLGKQDYYEDVLATAEASQSAIAARKEGQLGEQAPRNVRVGKTGLRRGFGADAIYYKHCIENRRARAFLLSPTALIFAVCSIGFAFFMRGTGFIPAFAFATYMQFFTVAMGRLNRELLKPYIYLIPEPPLQKLLQSIRELLPSSLAEAVVVMVPMGLILGMGPADILMGIVARLGFALLFTAANLATERIWGGSASKVLVMLLYLVIILVMAAPGIILAIVLSAIGVVLISSAVTAFLAMTVLNVLLSLLVLFLCRNVLQYAELNTK